MNCMALHKKGLFAAGEDGVLRHLEVTSDRVHVVQAYPVGSAISSLAFNAPHNKLGLGSLKVSKTRIESSQRLAVEVDEDCCAFLSRVPCSPTSQKRTRE